MNVSFPIGPVVWFTLLSFFCLGCVQPHASRIQALPEVDPDFSFIVIGETTQIEVLRVLGEPSWIQGRLNEQDLHYYWWNSVHDIGGPANDNYGRPQGGGSDRNNRLYRGAVQEQLFRRVLLELEYDSEGSVSDILIQGPVSG